jgi:methionyl-tRNA synthetase
VLLALGVPLPKCVFAHGWWTSEGKKMSKTLGNFVSRDEIAEICREYSRDVYRYFLLRAVSFGADGDFSRQALQSRYNNDLANGVGNLLSRTVNMIGRYFDALVPAPGAEVQAAAPVRQAAEALVAAAPQAMAVCRFDQYLDAVFVLVDATNRFIDVTQPFKLAKDPAQRDALGSILYVCAEAVRLILVYLGPVMPETTDRALRQLGCAGAVGVLGQASQWGALAPGTKTEKGEGLFPRKS